ncbi:MAG: DEAD/DEAH box helicase family protein [Candidatus Diapherotrites archaeon]|nr:DEAD/DEAH box helicase family protein [Candidatus Diapherotrites archaeon]
MITLKDYQEKAVKKLFAEVSDLLNYTESKICVFDAPTGSGKTIMMAEFLKRLAVSKEKKKDLAFIWISVNQLHNQSKDKLERYFEDTRILKCSDFEDLEDRMIGRNEILFFNWQSINKADNIYIRENEYDNNLSKIVENTKENGRDILLVIDESHHSAKAPKSLEVIELINPKVTIEVSATPQITNINAKVEVDFQDVKEEGMIKNEVQINPEIDQKKVGMKSADEFVIQCALEKQAELVKQYRSEGSAVNPLILIQIPDSRQGSNDKKDDVIAILRNQGITTENRKLAIYLSEKDNKINLENIEKNENETEVMIFKQAIALGWDCPRAAILILFRDWKSITFSIQTIGRIMRMPEARHYESEGLNKGYVFTNLSEIKIAEGIAKDYITVLEAKRRTDLYNPVDLQSVYLKRAREKTRLSGEFTRIFQDTVNEDRLSKKLNMKPTALVNEILVDGKIEKLDKVQDVKHGGELEIAISERELQERFDSFLKLIASPFAPADSMRVIKTSLYKFFENKLNILDYTTAQRIILSKENNPTFIDQLNKAKEKYWLEVVEKVMDKKEKKHFVWNVPLLISYTSKFKEKPMNKSIMKPFYAGKESKPEEDFIGLLEDHNNKVKWWYKNGDNGIKYFAIPYADIKGIERSFYVDFIVQMKDGRIGLFDTKGGRTAEDAKEKAEALRKYIDTQNTKHSKKLYGGIVVFKDGSCRYNGGKNYEFNEKNLGEKWDFLSFR